MSQELDDLRKQFAEEYFKPTPTIPTNQRVYHVREEARDQIPKTIKVYTCLSGGGMEQEFKWSRSYTVYKRESISDSKQGWLEVTYKRAKRWFIR
jgi:hypothetical protein